ncbi:DUF6461 domain-containing protein [Streptosporangium soli]|nr:DUF6461 domain-containing protein [Streptosporangium sp. KLBMP 9127]
MNALPLFGPAEREMTFDELSEKVEEFMLETGGGDGGGYVGVAPVGEWSVALELSGWRTMLSDTAAGLSTGCELVAVGRHDYAEHGFVYAVDGQIVTSFAPHQPNIRWGDDPDQINELMREAGFPPEALADDAEQAAWDDLYANGISRAFCLAAKITGVVLTPDILSRPLLVGSISQ